jgi:hypothetical protein
MISTNFYFNSHCFLLKKHAINKNIMPLFLKNIKTFFMMIFFIVLWIIIY